MVGAMGESSPNSFEWPAGWTAGPLHDTPRSVYPPYVGRQGLRLSDTELERAAALVWALRGVELGRQDARVLSRLARRDTATVATLVVLIQRARLAGPPA